MTLGKGAIFISLMSRLAKWLKEQMVAEDCNTGQPSISQNGIFKRSYFKQWYISEFAKVISSHCAFCVQHRSCTALLDTSSFLYLMQLLFPVYV
jgi:hypothetical protein